MQFDLYLVLGIVVLALAIPPVLNAVMEGHAPRVAAIMVLVGGGLVALAVAKKPGGYTIEDVPQAFVRVVAHYIR
ncbi:MAG: hypothetical protein ACRBCL_04985 [Maritimibacter sp.]